MGSCVNKETRLSQIIDKKIEFDQIKGFRVIRILLLGSGQSGKSTILKQMRILHKNGFSHEELEAFKAVIQYNVSSYMLTLLSAMKAFGIPFDDYSLQVDADKFLIELQQYNNDFECTPKSAKYIQLLWTDPGMPKCYKLRNEYQLPDCAKYFLDSIERISDPEYVPSYQDVLYARSPTSGVTETTFNSGQFEFRVLDVGGQRSERRKWLHIFDNVDALIFLTAISEYDQVLDEDRTKNRMQDSLALYDPIVNSHYFINMNIILFLNKIDLFKEKIENVSLKDAFPIYTGLQTYETCVFYIKSEFEKRTRNKERTVRIHETCATDTNQVKAIINSIIDNAMIQNQSTSGMC